MKKQNLSDAMNSHTIAVIMVSVTIISACGRSSTQKQPTEKDTVSVASPDTGYTGIKQFMSGQKIVSEVNFVNGLREGLTKTFYESGKLQRTFMYEKGLKQDSSCWFYEEGQLFRITPYKNDTIHGIQKQYYRTGELKAKMGYTNGFRNSLFQEFTREGRPVTDYPKVIIRTEDTYNKDGLYRIVLDLSDRNVNVKWLRGEFSDGMYDTSRMVKIRKTGSTGYLDLRKTGKEGQLYVGVVAEILTNFGNRMLVARKINLPYKDLK